MTPTPIRLVQLISYEHNCYKNYTSPHLSITVFENKLKYGKTNTKTKRNSQQKKIKKYDNNANWSFF